MAIGTYSGISIISCVSWSLVFSAGIDIKPVTTRMKELKVPYLNPEWSTFVGMVWAAHTVIFPIRFGLTVGLTPFVKKMIAK